MADEEVRVETGPRKIARSNYSGLSPVQAGIFGALAALPAGPLAPVVGLGTGIVQHFKRENYIDKQSKYLTNLLEERHQMKGLLDKEFEGADPDEKRMIEVARATMTDGYERLASGDASGEKLIADARSMLTGIVQGDIAQRKQEEAKAMDVQRGLVDTAARAYRGEYQNVLGAFQDVDMQATKILELTADPNFDPNKPVNRAHLAELLSMGGLMFRDAPNAMDAIAQGVSGLPGPAGMAAGGAAGGLATLMSSEEFKVSKEDYNRLALNSKHYAEKYAKLKLEQLGAQSKSLDAWGRKLGIVPDDFSLADYVSGGEKELRLTPVPPLKGFAKGTIDRSKPTETDNLINLLQKSQEKPKRPTN